MNCFQINQTFENKSIIYQVHCLARFYFNYILVWWVYNGKKTWHLWCTVNCNEKVATLWQLFFGRSDVLSILHVKALVLILKIVTLVFFIFTSSCLCLYQSNKGLQVLTVCSQLFQWCNHLFDMSPIYSKPTEYNAVQGNSFFRHQKQIC